MQHCIVALLELSCITKGLCLSQTVHKVENCRLGRLSNWEDPMKLRGECQQAIGRSISKQTKCVAVPATKQLQFVIRTTHCCGRGCCVLYKVGYQSHSGPC